MYSIISSLVKVIAGDIVYVLLYCEALALQYMVPYIYYFCLNPAKQSMWK